MTRVSKLLTTGLMLLATAAASAQEFKLSIDQCPGVVSGAAGETKAFDAFVKLTTSNNADPDGGQGWSVSVAVEGGSVKAVSVKGVVVQTLFDHDFDFTEENAPEYADPEFHNTTPLQSIPLDLNDAGFKVSQKATSVADPTVKGAVSAIVLHQTAKRLLLPNGSENILKLTIETTIPSGDDCSPLTIKFLDGLKGAGEPVKNVITYKGASVTPTKEDCVVQVCPPRPEFNLALVGKDQAGPSGDGGTTLLDLQVPPGAENSVVVNALLSTSGLPPDTDGPQGWSISVAHDACMTVGAVSVKGVVVQSNFDHDFDFTEENAPEYADPNFHNTTPLKSTPLDLNDAGFKVTQKATSTTDPTVNGVVSAIVLHQTAKRVLFANASDRILAITYKLPAVQAGETIECSARFEDLLKGAGEPVKNVITYVGASKTPFKKQGIRIRLTGITKPPKDSFARGDANNDGKNDIADAVTIVSAVVPALGGPPIVCKDAGNANADELLNLADAVYLIQYQFNAGPPPAAPFPGCGTTEGSSESTCPDGSTGCPAP